MLLNGATLTEPAPRQHSLKDGGTMASLSGGSDPRHTKNHDRETESHGEEAYVQLPAELQGLGLGSPEGAAHYQLV